MTPTELADALDRQIMPHDSDDPCEDCDTLRQASHALRRGCLCLYAVRPQRRAEGRMSWRIEPLDTERPVRIIIGGIGYCLTITDAMSLLRTAPKMAGKWTRKHSPNGTRDDMAGTTVSVVFGVKNAGGMYEWAAYAPTSRGCAETLQEAMDAADAALSAAGWLLEEG